MSDSSSKWRILKRIFFWIRLSTVVVLAAMAVRLVHWNREVDPRFFQFLSTPSGKALARVMKWPNLYDLPELNKPLEEYSEEEMAWRQKIEADLEATWPTHILHLKDGSIRKVQMIALGRDGYQVLENYGARGRLETTLPRKIVETVTPNQAPVPEVTLQDVHFQMEYPHFEIVHAGHYIVLTDAPYFEITASVSALETLRTQYIDIFEPLIRFVKADESLQLLYFTREAEYRAHQQKTAPLLENSIGYYSPLEDRMVLFNQAFSEHSESVRSHIEREVDFLSQQADTLQEQLRIRQFQERIEDELRDQANRETLATLRHEGAHHLSYTYGVHSWIHAENAWCIEGLAAYFESAIPGDPVSAYVEILNALKKENRIPPLADLVAVRLPSSFAEELSDIGPHEAYALSWSLFRFCMSPERRPAFFRYLQTLQDPKDIAQLMAIPRETLLAEAFEMTPSELHAAWKASL